MSLLELNNISFAYSKVNGFNLSEINLKIEDGNFVSIIGPNGSGKSTLLKLISNYLQPESGYIKLNGKNYTKSRYKRLSLYDSKKNVSRTKKKGT